MKEKNLRGPRITVLLGRIFLGAILGAAIGLAVGVLLPRTYTCAASILFPGAGRGGGGGGTPAGGGQPSGAPRSTEDQPDLSLMQGVLLVPQPGTSPGTAALVLESRQTSEDLIRRFGLDTEWRLPIERALDEFHRVFVLREGGAGDLHIVYTDPSPERARDMVEAAIETLNKAVEKMSLDPAQRNLDFLETNLKKAEASVAKQQDEIVRLQRASGGVTPDAQIQTLGQISGALQQQLTTAEVEASVAESSAKASTEAARKMIAAAQEPSGGPQASVLSQLYRTVVDRETDLSLLRQKFTDRRPEVVQATQALSVAKKSLDAEIARQASDVEQGSSPLVRDAVLEVITTRARMEGLRRSAGQVQKKLDVLPAVQVRYTQLQADLRDERTRLSLLRSEFSRAQLIVQTRGPRFVIVDPPVLPRRPDGYDLYYFPLLGLAGGIVLTLFVGLWGWIRRGIKSMSM